LSFNKAADTSSVSTSALLMAATSRKSFLPARIPVVRVAIPVVSIRPEYALRRLTAKNLSERIEQSIDFQLGDDEGGTNRSTCSPVH